MTIFSPVDRSVCKAVVIIEAGTPHSHPTWPYSIKPSLEAKEMFREAVHASGVLASSVRKVENGACYAFCFYCTDNSKAPTTKYMYKDTSPNANHTLMPQRVKRCIIQKEKEKEYPRGQDLEGML